MNPKILRKGYKILHYIRRYLKKKIFFVKVKIFHISEWKDPDENDFIVIESQLKQQGIPFDEIILDQKDIEAFIKYFDFGNDFYGGKKNSRVYKEKLLEHYISYTLSIQKMSSNKDIYIDVAAANSPWAKLLRDKGYTAYAIDLSPSAFKNLEYYKTMDATATSFSDASVGSISLQCAYEMFNHDDDIKLIHELKRILMRGGRAIISPFYMYTHYCGYCSPEFWDKPESHPKDAKVYVNLHADGIPFSRKYDAGQFQKRIVKTIEENNLDYHLYVLKNGKELDQNIYCHFILEIVKN